MRAAHPGMISCAVLALGLSVGCGGSDSAAGSGGGAGTGGADGGAAGAAGGVAASIALPQFVSGAALVDPQAFADIPIVIASGATPTATLDGAAVPVTADGARWIASVHAADLADGDHPLHVSAGSAEKDAVLVATAGGAQLSTYADVGAAVYSRVGYDAANDQLLVSWIDSRQDRHAWLARFDGAGRRVVTNDVQLDPTGAVRAFTAYGDGKIGVLYAFNKTVSGNPAIGMAVRVLDLDGNELVAPIDLNPDTPGMLGTQAALAWDGTGFSAFWADLQLTPSVVEKLYWMHVDPATGAKTGPVVVTTENADSTTGDGDIPDLQALAMACAGAKCELAWREDVYNALVLLSAHKVFLAHVDVAAGTATSNGGVYLSDWDIQEDPSLSATDAGSFLLSFAGTDTDAAVNVPDPCDESGRQKIYYAHVDANGAVLDNPLVVLNDDVGQRYQATVGAHPDGAAILWEDEREHCTDLINGQNRLAANFVVDGAVEGPYLPLPRSRLVVESFIGTVPTGSNYTVSWIDERAGGTLLDPRGEVFLETYWRK